MEVTLAALCVTPYLVSASDRIRDSLRQLVTGLNQWDSEILGRGVINHTYSLLDRCRLKTNCIFCVFVT